MNSIYESILKRRNFLKNAIVGGVTVAILPKLLFASDIDSSYVRALQKSKEMVDNGEPAKMEMVFEFVHKSHFSLERVKELHALDPTLVNAVWDWGGGDFESGLGAASHVGNREIAEFLISKGARPNLFAATMLGHLEIVKTFIENYPDLINCKGPHGLSLIHHAEKGKEQAKLVLEYLKGKA